MSLYSVVGKFSVFKHKQAKRAHGAKLEREKSRQLRNWGAMQEHHGHTGRLYQKSAFVCDFFSGIFRKYEATIDPEMMFQKLKIADGTAIIGIAAK